MQCIGLAKDGEYKSEANNVRWRNVCDLCQKKRYLYHESHEWSRSK